MIEKLSISDLNAILSRLKDENTKLWYSTNSDGEIQHDAQETVLVNEKLIAEIEAEIKNRVNNLAQAGKPDKNRSGSKITQAGEN